MTTEALHVVARTTAKPGCIAEVRSLLMGLVGPTRKEKDFISYQLLQDNSDPGAFTFIEEWANESAFDAHLASPHLQAALSRGESLLAEEPDIRRYTLLA